MTDLAVAVVLGAAFAIGVCLVVSLAPRWGAPSLARRIGPYIRDVTDPRGLTDPPPVGVAPRGWSAITGRVARSARDSSSLERRLRQAGWTMDVAAFRGRQLTAALAGVGLGGALLMVLALTGRGAPVIWVLPPVVGAACAFGCDLLLSRAVRARTARIDEELPTMLEFLALCLSAGEGILDSLRRVGDIGAGELTVEVRSVVLAVGTGSSLSESLTTMSRRLDIPALARAVDHLVAAIERGAPLAHVLHAQALDAREDARRVLLERAGRKEIAMLLPHTIA